MAWPRKTAGIALVTLLAAALPLRAAEPGVRPAWRFGREDGDAAPHYREALARWNALPEEQRARIMRHIHRYDKTPAPFDPADRAALAHAIDAFRTGARFNRCLWDWGPEPFGANLLEELKALRNLARLAQGDAECALDENRPEHGLATAFALLAFGRHYPKGGSLVNGLVGVGVRNIGRGAFMRSAFRWPRDAWPEVLAATRAIYATTPPSFGDAMRSEVEVYLEPIGRELATTDNPEAFLLRFPGLLTPEKRDAIPAAQRTREQWRAWTREMADWCLEAAATPGPPYALNIPALADVDERAQASDNPFVHREARGGGGLGRFLALLEVFRRDDLHAAQLLAAMACLAEPDRGRWNALPEMRDPFGTGPFLLERDGEGFILISMLPARDRRESSLWVGPPPAMTSTIPWDPPPPRFDAPQDEEVF